MSKYYHYHYALSSVVELQAASVAEAIKRIPSWSRDTKEIWEILMNALLFWSRTSEMFMIVNKNSFFCVFDWAFEARSDDSSFQRRPMAV